MRLSFDFLTLQQAPLSPKVGGEFTTEVLYDQGQLADNRNFAVLLNACGGYSSTPSERIVSPVPYRPPAIPQEQPYL